MNRRENLAQNRRLVVTGRRACTVCDDRPENPLDLCMARGLQKKRGVRRTKKVRLRIAPRTCPGPQAQAVARGVLGASEKI